MKKILIIVLLVVCGYFLFGAKKEILIPEEAIRFRVIANSNSEEDQEIKQFVGRKVQEQISSKLKNVYNVEEARAVLKENVPVFHETVEEALKSRGVYTNFNVRYGMNPFPEKIYKGVTYKEGNYESLVVNLGEGLGNNWWCVLFPPICLLEAEETEEKTNVEYKFFIQELIDKYFK